MFFHSFVALYLKSFQFDVVMTSRRDGKFLGLLYFFYKPRRLKHVIYEFIFERKPGWHGTVSWFIWKSLIKRIDRVLVQSTFEVILYSKLFGVPGEKFIFVPVAVETASNYIGPSAGGYLFSAGRTNRDYGTLLEALTNVIMPYVIVTGSKDKYLLGKLPAHARVYSDLDKQRYNQLLAGSRLVIITLKNGASSRGQVVLLEAMALGKPVICSDVPGVRDYVVENVNCRLVPPEDAAALKEKISGLLNSEPDLQRIGRGGYESIAKKFSHDNFCIHFRAAVNNALRS